jgi:hypothetical protein
VTYHPLYFKCFRRDGWKCRHCESRNGLHPHHVIYRSQQGPDALNNLITLCAVCHRAHHDGHLKIELVDTLVDNVIVYFHRVKNWRP